MLNADVRELAKGKNFATFTTLRPDGQPVAQVMWVDCDEDHVLINTEVHRAKFQNVQNDPRVVVCIIDATNPYHYAEVRGRVVDVVHGDAARRHADELSQLYFGRPYDPAQITSSRAVLRVLPL